MVVQVAIASGRTVAEVARQSFALTLWTWAELQEIEREETVRRLGERTDLAGQVAIAFHQPQDLQKLELRYLKAAGQLSEMFEKARSRASDLIAQISRASPQE